jgi:hypothetical protein
MEDKKTIVFIQEIYIRVTPTIEKILSGNNNNKLYIEILDINNTIASW